MLYHEWCSPAIRNISINHHAILSRTMNRVHPGPAHIRTLSGLIGTTNLRFLIPHNCTGSRFGEALMFRTPQESSRETGIGSKCGGPSRAREPGSAVGGLATGARGYPGPPRRPRKRRVRLRGARSWRCASAGPGPFCCCAPAEIKIAS